MENAATLYLTARLHSTMPTGNIPEAPELGTPRYNGQNVGPRSTVTTKVPYTARRTCDTNEQCCSLRCLINVALL